MECPTRIGLAGHKKEGSSTACLPCASGVLASRLDLALALSLAIGSQVRDLASVLLLSAWVASHAQPPPWLRSDGPSPTSSTSTDPGGRCSVRKGVGVRRGTLVVFEMYRWSAVGRALMETLDKMVLSGVLSPKLALSILLQSVHERLEHQV
ncbi:hypothetical protein CFC21_018119 [Triticum aestivum]|uniref:Transcription initiation factor IIA gamma subunit N-terminal domain-containing protein n=2 Tax=Triticum aestivum TaxID=4565 RepID=A0A3B6B2S8_WHEAT|nr:uncharacterized protein LOC119355811 isoform X2 [Triticum dicoccoides]XP_044458284.1 uncharacterized protein LOC123189843 isoform X2 [Triticum aestivum]KAF7002673.1 hypothetical protein CFC21_018119 [Triticum aestivum]